MGCPVQRKLPQLQPVLGLFEDQRRHRQPARALGHRWRRRRTGIGLEWYDPSTRTGFGATLTRSFDSNGHQTGFQGSLTWSGNQSLLNPASDGYVVHVAGSSASALYVTDDSTLSIGTDNLINGSNAPQPDGTKQWSLGRQLVVVSATGDGASLENFFPGTEAPQIVMPAHVVLEK